MDTHSDVITYLNDVEVIEFDLIFSKPDIEKKVLKFKFWKFNWMVHSFLHIWSRDSPEKFKDFQQANKNRIE